MEGVDRLDGSAWGRGPYLWVKPDLGRHKPRHLCVRNTFGEGERACDPLDAVVGPFVCVDGFDVLDQHVDEWVPRRASDE